MGKTKGSTAWNGSGYSYASFYYLELVMIGSSEAWDIAFQVSYNDGETRRCGTYDVAYY